MQVSFGTFGCLLCILPMAFLWTEKGMPSIVFREAPTGRNIGVFP